MTQNEIDRIFEGALALDVTLNGKPAKLCGRLMPFATVAALPNGESYQWSWEAVARILAAGGRFKS